MAGRYLEVEKDLTKMRNLEELIKDGMEITQECALDCEENEKGCPEVDELKEIMLAYANMTRDIKQCGIAARKTVADFHESFNPLGYYFHNNHLRTKYLIICILYLFGALSYRGSQVGLIMSPY